MLSGDWLRMSDISMMMVGWNEANTGTMQDSIAGDEALAVAACMRSMFDRK